MAGFEYLTLVQARDRLDRRDVSSVELTLACLDRINQVEDRIKSFVTLTPDLALKRAQEADRLIATSGAKWRTL